MAGRIMSRRIMGAASFVELQDASGKNAALHQRDDICPTEDKTLYNEVFKKLLDIGDIIGIEGFAFRTQMGEITIHVRQFSLLAKSLGHCLLLRRKMASYMMLSQIRNSGTVSATLT
jgi:lysyl-tRNA synthetase class 2